MSSSSDSFLQKTTEELLYLVQHPELYHAALVAEAGRELRRRGAAPAPLPAPDAVPVVSSYDYAEATPSVLARWWPAGLIATAVAGLAWWGLHSSSSPETAATPKPATTGPIILEAVKANRMPDFEVEAARQVAETRRQLPGPDRADTTAAGRYARMARRYWLAENSAAYLIDQVKADSVTGVFAGQADLALERITWFMRARAYDQHLTPTMEERLQLMQQGLTIRRSSLMGLKVKYESQGTLTADAGLLKADAEARGLGNEVRGRYQQKAAIRGNIQTL